MTAHSIISQLTERVLPLFPLEEIEHHFLSTLCLQHLIEIYTLKLNELLHCTNITNQKKPILEQRTRYIQAEDESHPFHTLESSLVTRLTACAFIKQ